MTIGCNNQVEYFSTGCYLIKIGSSILHLNDELSCSISTISQRLVHQMEVCVPIYAKVNSNQSQILHYALRDTVSTRKNILGKLLIFNYFYMLAILNFAYY